MKIKEIKAREILDSRGFPTVEATVILENGTAAKASVPAGVSIGYFEAEELRDNNPKRYGGKGVLRAVENINTEINSALKGSDVFKQAEIDNKMIELDGTKNKGRLGANAILAVSLSCARAGSLAREENLFEYLSQIYGFSGEYKIPTPCFNIFNGGKHADTNLDFQEFMIIPIKKTSFKEKLRLGAEVFYELGKILKKSGFDTDVGAEGGYAPDMASSIQALEFMLSAAISAGYNPGEDVVLGIDIGSSELFDQDRGKYIFKRDREYFAADNLIGLYGEWLRNFPIAYLEDGLSEGQWDDWKKLTKELGNKMMLVGDNLFATNSNRLRRGLKEKIANSIIIKPNQAGTLSETIECAELAKKHNYKIVVSHRSGETNDDFIADLAVALRADFIKAGSLSRGERVAKYNRLMEIEEIINSTK
jgi:enolase